MGLMAQAIVRIAKKSLSRPDGEHSAVTRMQTQVRVETETAQIGTRTPGNASVVVTVVGMLPRRYQLELSQYVIARLPKRWPTIEDSRVP
jgi:hypothetical protein